MTYRIYERVSTTGQSLESQTFEIDQWLKAHDIKKREVKRYRDKLSGKTTKRPQFQKMLADLQAGDTVIVAHLDRLSRSFKQIHETLALIKSKGCQTVILSLPQFETSDPLMNEFMQTQLISLMSFVADMERQKISDRTKQGLAVAKEKGLMNGMPPLYSPNGKRKKEYKLMVKLYQEGASVAEISRETEIARSTIYEIIKRDGLTR